MSTSPENPQLWRARELLGSVGVLAWAGFHLWEQWAAFAGRGAFVDRMSGTSHGTVALLTEVAFGIVPPLAWLALEARLLWRAREPEAIRYAMSEDEELGRRLGVMVRVASWFFFWSMVVHIAWLFVPKLFEGSEPLLAWLRMRDEFGTWPVAAVHAIGLSAFAIHLWGAIPRVVIVLGWAESPESRRAARLSGVIVAIGLLVLFAQLAGWHAAGTGTVWPM